VIYDFEIVNVASTFYLKGVNLCWMKRPTKVLRSSRTSPNSAEDAWWWDWELTFELFRMVISKTNPFSKDGLIGLCETFFAVTVDSQLSI